MYGPRGDLYFTDPPFGLPAAFDDAQRELPWQGVYRLNAAGDVELLTKEIRAPNGIAFSPDGRTLYISNADRDQAVLAFDVAADGSIGNRRVFFDVTRYARDRPGGPDGMETDIHDNLFAAGPGGVYIVAPDGTRLGRILLGTATSNVGWGAGANLWVTAGNGIYRVPTMTHPPSS